jgi:N-acetylglucosamine-6-phosphate deacetylase
MILKNAKIFDKDFNIIPADISVCGEKITSIAPEIKGDEYIDLTGCLITPGFVDIHIHGCVGADTCDGTRESIEKMAGHLITEGVTSFCPTTMTVSLSQIKTVLSVVKDCIEHPPEGATICGINMEGPYISANRKGAQKAEYVRQPDWQEFKQLYDDCGGIIKLVDIAPECEGAEEFIDHVSKFCKVSLAHTEADYEQAKESFRHGITHVTHLYNAMNGLNHRKPGVVGAVFDNNTIKTEIICDGFHIHPAVLRATFRLLGEDRTIIISDSMRAEGMPDGDFDLGGQKVYVKNGWARLADGTIAGSTTNLHQEVKNLIRFGIPLRHVIKSATINPAKEIGMEEQIGSIQVGKRADLVVMDQDWNIVLVIKAGKLYRKNS